MKSSFDLKHGIGKVTPENPDDLWVLEGILKEGDLITAKTPRSQDIVRDGKKERGPKKLVLLTVQLEKMELDNVLKLRGKIVAGPENVDRGYHTIEADAGTFMTIKREWKSWEVSKIKKAADKTEPVLVLILDEREADLYRVRGKVEHLVHITGKNIGKGGDISGRKGYFGEIISVLEGKEEKIVVAGPGFARDDLVKEIKERKSNVGKIIIEGCSHTGMNGIEEVLKRKVLDRVIKSSRLEEEVEEVEKFFEAIAKDGKVTYGKNEVERATESGAVEKILISEKLVRENEKLLEGVEKIGGKIMIISEESQNGKKFSGIGGIGAFLRYRME